MGEPRIRVSAILRWQSSILLCRHEKNGRDHWLLPGGGVDSGESLVDALHRELAEEVGIDDGVPVEGTDPKSKELIQNFNALTAEDGIAYYPDWPTPTFYDQLNAGLQELINGTKSPADVNKELGSEYQSGVDDIVNQ